MLLTLLTILYVSCALLLSFYALGAVVLLVAYWRHRHDRIPTPTVKQWPTVAIQLPIYNERFVVERLLDSVAHLDYPRECLTIQVLDDSTDDTSVITAEIVARWQRQGLNMHHIRRGKRTGYKAGALAYGLSLLDTEYVAVLDADFVPPPDFLRRIIPHLVDNPRLGMVQARWGHLNPYGNLLTLGQTLALDGHFVVEQTGRNRSGWLMNFNGSGGVWRVSTIHDAGGWNDNTLTEDLDLSYRAQLKGWRFLYLPDVVVPGELPPQMAAYKQQQARWAKGGTQCLSLLFPTIWWAAHLSLTQRVMATLHLGQYLTAPMIVLLLLLTPLLLLTGAMSHVQLGWMGLSGLGPPLVFVASQHALYADWYRRILALPALITLGTGMAWNNTLAVIGGLVSKKGEFRRTPKGKPNSRYALRLSKSVWVEFLLSAYALWGTSIAMKGYPALVPYLALYGVAFALVALWGIRDLLPTRVAH